MERRRLPPTETQSRRGPRWMTMTPPVAMVVYGVLLLAYHVQADRNQSLLHNTHSKETRWNDAFVSWVQRMGVGPTAWEGPDFIFFGVLILLAFELLDFLTKHAGPFLHKKQIPVRGKHLDELSPRDVLFIGLSKAATPPFVYFYLRYVFYEPNIVWKLQDASLQNLVLPLFALFVVFDFFYTIIHWALHIKAIYGYIHKHHHHQKAPSRANVDAVNVHPVEFFLGEYDHLWSLFLCCQVMQVHVISTLVFLVVSGVVAGLNHTRFDFVLSIFGWKIYDSKAHDVHHRIPQSNYGQYTMFWDYIFRSYRPYDENDRINPKAQLDPKTGKSFEYMEAKKLAAKLA